MRREPENRYSSGSSDASDLLSSDDFVADLESKLLFHLGDKLQVCIPCFVSILMVDNDIPPQLFRDSYFFDNPIGGCHNRRPFNVVDIDAGMKLPFIRYNVE